jgi:hypothetical protein
MTGLRNPTADTPLHRRSSEFAVGPVGVAGLGRMGHAFALNFLEDGQELWAHDRRRLRN